MIQISKITYHDDNEGSISMSTMVCSSINSAKGVILNELNKGFEGNWASLSDAATELSNDLMDCEWDEEKKTFHWGDNGKGETYIIVDINISEVNTKFQEEVYIL